MNCRFCRTGIVSSSPIAASISPTLFARQKGGFFLANPVPLIRFGQPRSGLPFLKQTGEFSPLQLLQSCYSQIVLELLSIIGGLALIFSVLVYDWWKYGRVRD